MLKTRNVWEDRAILFGTLFVGFSAVHLIDEFLWDAPAEFHLSVPSTLLLALIYMLALSGMVVLAARGSPTALGGLSLSGLLITLGDVLKHGLEIIQPGPWRSGLASELLAIGLTISAAATAVASFSAWRSLTHGSR